VLAYIEPDTSDNSFATVVIGNTFYKITREKKSGWRFRLFRIPDQSGICEFIPFYIRRGGRLRADHANIILGSRMLKARAWYLRLENGLDIDLDVKGRSGGATMTINLNLRHGMSDQFTGSLDVIMFGVWLVLQWEAISLPTPSGPPILFEGL
jgi:hypothetical protein